MQIHFFTKYTEAGASSRYRSFQYIPFLQRLGWDVQVSPLFNDEYLSQKYRLGKANKFQVLRAYMRRLLDVLRLPRGSLAVIEYELFPYLPALMERLLFIRCINMIVDYDDALFHQYDQHRHPLVWLMLSKKISTVMRLSHTVVAGNPYLAKYALQAAAPRVMTLPTVIDLAKYDCRITRESKPLVIGWVGSPSTAKYLQDISPALAVVCKRFNVLVRLVGSGPVIFSDFPMEVLAWEAEGEVEQIRSFDVGIMPLPNEPWARGKCGFKLIQYMGCGLPVVASPVGVNTEIVTDGVNGFLATSIDEWVLALTKLLGDTELRDRFGREGRARVEQSYCLAVTAPQLIELLTSIGDSSPCAA